jgi:cellulose biosynthesis protein BcsQ
LGGQQAAFWGMVATFLFSGGLLGYFGRYLQYRTEMARIRNERDLAQQKLQSDEHHEAALSAEAEKQLDLKIDNVAPPDEGKLKSILTTLNALDQAVRAQPEDPVRFIVLASGKGGVGKSTLGLGLLEFYCATGNTLLVDFDLPNRGLTSLLQPYLNKTAPRKIERTLEAMERFHTETMKKVSSDLAKRPMAEATAGGDDRSRRMALRELLTDFYAAYVDHVNPKPLNLFNFASVSRADINVPNMAEGMEGQRINIQPDNAFFMPSVNPGQFFLSSPIFEAPALEVFYFLQTLGRWALQTRGIETIILDCHGAHDLFMVGAIQAASDLIVTMTPEPGSFDGTLDLLAFAAQSNRAGADPGSSTVTLVINNVGAWQRGSEEKLKVFFKGEKGRPFAPTFALSIPHDQKVQQVLSSYTMGGVAASPLWSRVCEIGKNLDRDVNELGAELANFEAEGGKEVHLESPEHNSGESEDAADRADEQPDSRS